MITFLIDRAKRHWQVLSTVLLGVVVSTAFLASGPIVVNTVINFALLSKLRASLGENGTLFLSTYNSQGEIGYDEINKEIYEIIEPNIGKLPLFVSSTASPWVYPWQDGVIVADERINFRSYSGVDERITFKSGGWPEDRNNDPETIRAIVSEQMAAAYSLVVGDQLPISEKINETQPSYWVEITGVYQMIEASDPYWLIQANPLAPTNNRYLAEFGVILPTEDYFLNTIALFPRSNFQQTWLAIINPAAIHSDNITAMIAGIESIRSSLTELEPKVAFDTNLDKFLEDFNLHASEIIPPLYLIIGEVLFLGLYYVTMVAALSVRQVEGELSIIVSRGADFSQLLRIQLFDVLLICATAFLLGPILAYGLIFSLARIGPLADLSQVDWIVRLPAASWKAAGISVLACFTALIVPVIPILRGSIVHYHQKITRRNTSPWWHRYYVDILLLLIGLIAIWRFSLYQSISGINADKFDWLLLLAPLVLLIGSAAFLLRIFPVVYKFLAYLGAQGRGLTAVLALWHTARDPIHATKLILLFTLAIALGVLSTGLNATLSSSETERARYSTGGEARLSFESFISPSTIDSMPQFSTKSLVWRGNGRANVRSYRNIPEFSILAIEPLSFASVAQFRTDFSEDYIGYVLGQLIVDPENLPVSKIPLPGEPTNLGVWIVDPYPERSELDILEYVYLRAKIQSAEGQISIVDFELIPEVPGTEQNPETISKPVADGIRWYQNFPFISNENIDDLEEFTKEPPQHPTWRYFEAPLPQYAEQAYPLSLHSLWIKIRGVPSESGNNTPSQGPLIMDDLSIKDSSDNQQVFEGFEELKTIWQTESTLSLASFSRHELTHSGEASMRLYLGSSSPSNWMVLSPAQSTRLNFIPVLVSPYFLEMTELNVGDKFSAFINGTSLILEIKNTVNYFPTMYESGDEGFVIMSRDALLVELNRASRIPVNINEIWLRVDESQETPILSNLFPQARQTWEVTAEKLRFKTDPLTLGLRSVIYLGYSITFFLGLVGFSTHFFLSTKKRSSMYGILRSLGLSTNQLYRSLVLEQLLIILSGLGLGIVLGNFLNRLILPGIPISFADVPAIPPFFPHADWKSILNLILLLLFGFLITLVIGTYFLWRQKLHQVLRVEEE